MRAQPTEDERRTKNKLSFSAPMRSSLVRIDRVASWEMEKKRKKFVSPSLRRTTVTHEQFSLRWEFVGCAMRIDHIRIHSIRFSTLFLWLKRD